MNVPRYGFLKTSGVGRATLNVSGPTNFSALRLAGQLELQLRVERHRCRLERGRRPRPSLSFHGAGRTRSSTLGSFASSTRMLLTVVVASSVPG